MDISNLRAFITVAATGSFSRAAEQLCLTQPAVSKRITALEEQLDARLFDRIGRRVTLTEAGALLRPRAEHILAELEDSRRAITNLKETIAGRLSIGTSHHIGLHRLPPVLRTYTTAYPEVELDLHFKGSEAACQAVEHGELELAIVTLPSKTGLQKIPIWNDPLKIVAGRDHALATNKTSSVEELVSHTAILPSRGTHTRELLEKKMASLGLELQVGLSTNYLETIKMMVSVGLGWSILPTTMVDNEICTLPIAELQLQRNLGVIRHRNRTLSNAASALVSLLESGK